MTMSRLKRARKKNRFPQGIDPDTAQEASSSTTVPIPLDNPPPKKKKKAKRQQQPQQRLVTVAAPLKSSEVTIPQEINPDRALKQARREARKLENQRLSSTPVMTTSVGPALVSDSTQSTLTPVDNPGISDYISLTLPDDDKRKERRPQGVKRRLDESQSVVAMAHPWTEGNQYESLANVAIMLHQEILDFVRYISPTPEEHMMRKYVVRRIEKQVLDLWPSAQVFVFGSFNTQLYLPTSDIDVVVLFSYPKSLKSLLHQLASALHNSGVVQAQSLQVIEKAKVPIIKFIEAVTRIHVDVSFNLTTGIASARISKRLLRSTPALRPLTMVMKHFLHQRGLNQVFSGGLGSYSIMCMIVSFLQVHPKVVSGEIKAEHNLGVLLIEFFELYGKLFNYEHVGIRIDNAGGYYPKIKHSRQQGQRPPLFSIQDPQDPTKDVARGSFAIFAIRGVLNGAYEQLTSTMFERNLGIERVRARDQAQRQQGLHTRFGDDGTHDDADNHLQANSILGVIIGMSPEDIRQREHVTDQFRAGVMQQMYGELKDNAFDDDKESEEEEEKEDVIISGPAGSKHGRDSDASFGVYKRTKVGFDMRNKRNVEYMRSQSHGDVEYVAEDEDVGKEGGTGWHEDENMLNLPQLIGIDKESVKEEKETAKRRVAVKRKFWKGKAGDREESTLE